MSTELPPYTLGQLILELESSERAYQDSLRTADRVEAKDGHNIASTWWRVAAGALLFQPDPARHPGIDRIEALCDEWGTGLKAENVRRLRGKVCSKLGVGVTEANAMTLDAVAAALGLGVAGANTNGGASSSPLSTLRSDPISEAGRSVSMVKVLLLSANPLDAPLSIEEEFRAIDAKIRASDHREHVQLIPHGAVRLEDIPGLLMRHKPHVVHFSGHGDAGAIELTRADGSNHLVPPAALTDIFRVLKDNVRVVLLNACDSAPQAEAIVDVIDCAVGMSDEIEDGAAIAFAAAFYEALGYGRSVQDAFDLALVQLVAAGADRSLAKLHKRWTVKPAEIILVNPPRPQ
jgi:hypothetical protein